jgi:AraC family transcriptional regulator
MAAKVLHDGPLRVLDYRCEAGPAVVPFTEVHERYSLSYVRRGSFGCRTLGRHFELVAGGFMLGCPGEP